MHEVVVEVDVGAGPGHDPAASELLGLDQPVSQSAVSIYTLHHQSEVSIMAFDQSEVSIHTLHQSQLTCRPWPART